jgi:acetylornithine deacetylase
LRGDLVLEAVVGEECMNHEIGLSATPGRAYAADGAVALEPATGSEADEITFVAPGQLWFTMSVRGKVTQHAANRGQTLRPGEGVEPPGVSAIDNGFLLDAGLRRLKQEWAFSKCHPLYHPAQFTIVPEVIEGGTTQEADDG